MKRYLFLIILLFSISNSFSQISSNKILGNWVFKGYVGKKQTVECPDVLVFEKGVYTILNDCYGKDIEYPITEKGRWTFSPQKNTIVLTNRKFTSNYTFQGKAKTLTLYIKETGDKVLKVSFNSVNGSIALFERK